MVPGAYMKSVRAILHVNPCIVVYVNKCKINQANIATYLNSTREKRRAEDYCYEKDIFLFSFRERKKSDKTCARKLNVESTFVEFFCINIPFAAATFI